jgi:hypothetical protein
MKQILMLGIGALHQKSQIMKRTMKSIALPVLLLSLLSAPLLAQDEFPEVIPLPGLSCEGIAIGPGSTFYVGSAPHVVSSTSGEIQIGDLRSGTYSQLVASTGVAAGDMHLDRRTGLLWVATLGGAIVEAYDATSGALVQSYALGAGAVPNDLVITRHAVCVTDFFKPYLYRIGLGPDGTPLGTFDVINIPALGGGAFLGNGIVEARGGAYLIVGLSGPGQLAWISTAEV